MVTQKVDIQVKCTSEGLKGVEQQAATIQN